MKIELFDKMEQKLEQVAGSPYDFSSEIKALVIEAEKVKVKSLAMKTQLNQKNEEIRLLSEQLKENRAKVDQYDNLGQELSKAESECFQLRQKANDLEIKIRELELEIRKLKADKELLEKEKINITEECELQVEMTEYEHEKKFLEKVQEAKAELDQELEKFRMEIKAENQDSKKQMEERERKLLQTTKDLRGKLVAAEEEIMVLKQRQQQQADRQIASGCDNKCKQKILETKVLLTNKIRQLEEELASARQKQDSNQRVDQMASDLKRVAEVSPFDSSMCSSPDQESPQAITAPMPAKRSKRVTFADAFADNSIQDEDEEEEENYPVNANQQGARFVFQPASQTIAYPPPMTSQPPLNPLSLFQTGMIMKYRLPETTAPRMPFPRASMMTSYTMATPSVSRNAAAAPRVGPIPDAFTSPQPMTSVASNQEPVNLNNNNGPAAAQTPRSILKKRKHRLFNSNNQADNELM